uniref:DNA-directed RNA polymerase III subunit RPC9 n=1 Tax=Arcella intermedia TaxID=1963864 RepID=A0A6B2LIE4_9EUKA
MKVIDYSNGWVTNFEVYANLKADKIKNSIDSQNSSNIDTIQSQVLEYLEHTRVPKLSPDSIGKCMTTLSKFPLSKAEKLEILNHAPILPVEVHMIIQDTPGRFSSQDELRGFYDEVSNIVKDNLIDPNAEQQYNQLEAQVIQERNKKLTRRISNTRTPRGRAGRGRPAEPRTNRGPPAKQRGRGRGRRPTSTPNTNTITSTPNTPAPSNTTPSQ